MASWRRGVVACGEGRGALGVCSGGRLVGVVSPVRVTGVFAVDDGTGTAGVPGSRRGLAGLRERAIVFGGQFEAGRNPQGGWKVRASFPTAP